jgi:hypothetical protein
VGSGGERKVVQVNIRLQMRLHTTPPKIAPPPPKTNSSTEVVSPSSCRTTLAQDCCGNFVLIDYGQPLLLMGETVLPACARKQDERRERCSVGPTESLRSQVIQNSPPYKSKSSSHGVKGKVPFRE